MKISTFTPLFRLVTFFVILSIGHTHDWNAAAQEFPNKPIKIIVGQGAGGGIDTLTRIVAQKLSEHMGQPVVIENKVGAGGIIGTEFVAKAPADGYTLLMAPSGNMVFTPILMPKLRYNPIKDFTPVSLVATFPLVLLVNSKLPIYNVSDLINYMKANPSKSNYGGSGPAFQFSSELFKLKTNTPAEFIQYKSTSESITALMAGDLLFCMADTGPAIPAITSSQVRALAVTSPNRISSLPNVPTMSEIGLSQVEFKLWSGLFAPIGTPAAVIKKLETEVARVTKMPEVIALLNNNNVQATSSTSEELGHLLSQDLQRWGQVQETAKISIQP
jgi:tripartite-type tricarboxylate transporter receptor subunit TctC